MSVRESIVVVAHGPDDGFVRIPVATWVKVYAQLCKRAYVTLKWNPPKKEDESEKAIGVSRFF